MGLARASRLVVIIPLLLLLVALAPAARVPARTVKHSATPIEASAMAGPRLAYAASDGRSCARIWIWNVRTGKQTRGSACLAQYNLLRALAVDDHRTAWVLTTCGNSECNDDLYTASSPANRNRRLIDAHRVGVTCASSSGCRDGDWVEGLVGSGNLLAVSRWSEGADGAITDAGLDVLGANGLQRVVAGPQGIVAWTADAGRIAVLRPAGPIDGHPGLNRYDGSSVGIYSAAGRLLRTITPGSAKDVALRGDWLLVLTETATLDAYNVRTGVRLHSWRVPRGATTLDAYGGVAVYANHPSGDRFCCDSFWVHALRLSTGKDVVLGHGDSWSAFRAVEIEAPGLVYARDPHDLVFVPLARVLAAVTPRT